MDQRDRARVFLFMTVSASIEDDMWHQWLVHELQESGSIVRLTKQIENYNLQHKGE